MPTEDIVGSRYSFMTQHHFRYKLMLDDLPAARIIRVPEATEGENTDDVKLLYTEGIPLGSFNDEDITSTIYNHLSLIIETH